MIPPQETAREQARHQIAVMQAWVDGKEIQFKGINEPDWWQGIYHPTWQFDLYDYRVKPEERKPREIYLMINTDGTDAVVFRKHNLDDEPKTMLPGYEIAKFREVLPSENTGGQEL